MAVSAALSPVLLYFLAAFVGAMVPANAGWREPDEGVTIFVRTNGVHTWILLPAVSAEMDWRRIAPAAHIREPAGSATIWPSATAIANST
jgi:hypothetical protein